MPTKPEDEDRDTPNAVVSSGTGPSAGSTDEDDDDFDENGWRGVRFDRIHDDSKCKDCGAGLSDDTFETDAQRGDFFCPTCMFNRLDAQANEARPEAREFARTHCRLTAPVPIYDPSRRYAPSRDDYEAGFRSAYTENSILAYARHNCTNYDELLIELELDRHNPVHGAWYEAIREQADRLVQAAQLTAKIERDRQLELLGDLQDELEDLDYDDSGQSGGDTELHA